MKTAVTAFLLTGVVVTFDGSAAQRGGPVAITNVSVVPMDSHSVLADHTVIVTNDRITAMGPSAATLVPDGAIRIEGRGKDLMPGLAEMHGHIPPSTTPEDFTADVLFLYGAFTRLAHAARSYSCKSPPRRSRRFSFIASMAAHLAADVRPFGGAMSRLRCGRQPL